MPLSAIVRGVVVEFADLWKICAPLRNVQGFTMTPFDKLIKVRFMKYWLTTGTHVTETWK